MTEEAGTAKLAEALCKAQAVMSGAKKDKKNSFFKSSFADLASVFDAIREPFALNDLSVSQTMDVLENGRMILKTRLMHSSGQYLESKMIFPDIADPQKVGSFVTYYRRYSLMAIAGIPAEDDDGNQAAGKPRPPAQYITSKQVAALEEIINGHEGIRQLVLSNCEDRKLENITVDRYPGAVAWIKELVQKEEEENE